MKWYIVMYRLRFLYRGGDRTQGSLHNLSILFTVQMTGDPTCVVWVFRCNVDNCKYSKKSKKKLFCHACICLPQMYFKKAKTFSQNYLKTMPQASSNVFITMLCNVMTVSEVAFRDIKHLSPPLWNNSGKFL